MDTHWYIKGKLGVNRKGKVYARYVEISWYANKRLDREALIATTVIKFGNVGFNLPRRIYQVMKL